MGGLSGASTAHAAPSIRLYFLTTLSRIWFRRHASGMMMSSSSSLAVSPRRSSSLSAAASSRCSFMNMHSYVPVDPRPIREGTAQGSSSPPGETPPRTRAATARSRRLPAAETSPPADRRPSGASRAAPAAAR